MLAIDRPPPPPSEVFRASQFPQRHPHLLSENRVTWAVRHRRTNGLDAAGAVFESPCGELMIHEPAFLAWFLGLAGRAKPRAPRKVRCSRA
jgi:hypothetical protein